MSYEVKVDRDTITVEDGTEQVIRYTVSNTSDRDLETAVTLRVDEDVKEEWVVVTPLGDRVIPARQSEIYEVRLTPKNQNAACSGRVSIEAAWVSQPNKVFTRGPDVNTTIVPAVEKGTWWKSHGWKVLAGVAGVLVIALILVFVFSGSSTVSITEFAATPAAGAGATEGEPPTAYEAGGLATFRWSVDGDVTLLKLERPNGEPVMMTPEQFEEGSIDLPLPTTPAEYTFTLIAQQAVDGDAVLETHSTTTLLVPAPPVTLVPASIANFQAQPNQVEAGDPVVISWQLNGDVARAALIMDEGQMELDANTVTAGQFSQAFLAGRHRVALRVLGRDGGQVDSNPVDLAVTEKPEMPQIAVFRVSGGTSRRMNVTDARLIKAQRTQVFFQTVNLEWEVTGKPRYVKVDIGGVEQTLDIKGRQEFPIRSGTEETVVTLRVGLRDGSEIQRSGTIGGARMLETLMVKDRLQLDPNLRTVQGFRAIERK